MSNEKNYMNESFVLSRFFTVEQALERVKRNIEQFETRASEEFKSTLRNALLSDINYEVKYAPVYRVFTKGAYNWTETTYQNVGNALIGDYLVGTEHTKSKQKDLDLVIDKSDTFGIMLSLNSYMKDKRKVLESISADQVFKLPLLYPMLTMDAMVKELSSLMSRKHTGSYNVDDLSVYLILVPVVEFDFEFRGEVYEFYVSLYDGDTDTLDVEISPEIKKTYSVLEKIYKYSNIAKIVIIGVFVLDLIIGIVRASMGYLVGGYLGGFIGLWVFSAIVSGLLIIPSWKKQIAAWKKLSQEYEYSDEYIKDDGKLKIKAMFNVAFCAIQVIIPFLCLLLLTPNAML